MEQPVLQEFIKYEFQPQIKTDNPHQQEIPYGQVICNSDATTSQQSFIDDNFQQKYYPESVEYSNYAVHQPDIPVYTSSAPFFTYSNPVFPTVYTMPEPQDHLYRGNEHSHVLVPFQTQFMYSISGTASQGLEINCEPSYQYSQLQLYSMGAFARNIIPDSSFTPPSVPEASTQQKQLFAPIPVSRTVSMDAINETPVSHCVDKPINEDDKRLLTSSPNISTMTVKSESNRQLLSPLPTDSEPNSPDKAKTEMESHPKLQHTTQTGPIPASKPMIALDSITGDEVITFSYSKQKIIRTFSLKKPRITFDPNTLPEDFRRDNCIYPRAMVPVEQYKGNRGKYERECNDLGWIFAWFNPEIRGHRGLIQRAVDSWRNTRCDKKIRSRRVRRIEGKTKCFIYC
ncbi:hypothetical protein WICPIJ_008127 [Wickerhamomyces pijperi]|uniref:DUF8032 domain-containing protein n=1 Tax=Wickerhamomyces pijperi TaxID=599730 RepID=A0A9P8Q071_WICPI|nr:hypothetical protein WICPIJ_008127 [Wickerhamomyces pijperi]